MAATKRSALFWRGFLVLSMLIIEIILITHRFDTGSQIILRFPHPLYSWLFHAGKFARFILAASGALFIFSLGRRKSILVIIDNYKPDSRDFSLLLLHVLSCAVFYFLCRILLEQIPANSSFSAVNIYALGLVWVVAALSVVVSLMLWLAGYRFWKDLFLSENLSILAAGIAGLLALGIGILSTQAWKPLAQITFGLAEIILRLLYQQIISDPANFELGTETFSVMIAPVCSGYEGIGLITAFLSLYLWLFRSQLRFPHVFILFPISISAIWLLNVFRIVVLIVIGDKISPEIAAGGFHSSAGWIMFILLSIIIILICQQLAFFRKNETPTAAKNSYLPDLALALLLPFILLMTSILIATAMSSHFDWFYPLKVLISLVALGYFRNAYLRYRLDISIESVLIGVLVFGVWLLLVPVSLSDDHLFAAQLFSQSERVTQVWLFCRFAGASITVPIIEELAFRGYLIPKLINRDFENVPDGKFTWLSFLGSSLLFGILHGQWLAGFVAGLAFALALYRRGALVDAVVAHMVTNLLLSVYILYSGHWSLW